MPSTIRIRSFVYATAPSTTHCFSRRTCIRGAVSVTSELDTSMGLRNARFPSSHSASKTRSSTAECQILDGTTTASAFYGNATLSAGRVERLIYLPPVSVGRLGKGDETIRVTVARVRGGRLRRRPRFVTGLILMRPTLWRFEKPVPFAGHVPSRTRRSRSRQRYVRATSPRFLKMAQARRARINSG